MGMLDDLIGECCCSSPSNLCERFNSFLSIIFLRFLMLLPFRLCQSPMEY